MGMRNSISAHSLSHTQQTSSCVPQQLRDGAQDPSHLHNPHRVLAVQQCRGDSRSSPEAAVTQSPHPTRAASALPTEGTLGCHHPYFINSASLLSLLHISATGFGHVSLSGQPPMHQSHSEGQHRPLRTLALSFPRVNPCLSRCWWLWTCHEIDTECV